MPIHFDENGELDCQSYRTKSTAKKEGTTRMKCRDTEDEGWENAIRGKAVNVWPNSVNTGVEGPATTIDGTGSSVMVVKDTVCAIKDGNINCAPDTFDYGD